MRSKRQMGAYKHSCAGRRTEGICEEGFFRLVYKTVARSSVLCYEIGRALWHVAGDDRADRARDRTHSLWVKSQLDRQWDRCEDARRWAEASDRYSPSYRHEWIGRSNRPARGTHGRRTEWLE